MVEDFVGEGRCFSTLQKAFVNRLEMSETKSLFLTFGVITVGLVSFLNCLAPARNFVERGSRVKSCSNYRIDRN